MTPQVTWQVQTAQGELTPVPAPSKVKKSKDKSKLIIRSVAKNLDHSKVRAVVTNSVGQVASDWVSVKVK